MKLKTIWIATSNQNKVAEFKKLMTNYEVKSLLDLPQTVDIIEDGLTFEENAMIKAKTLAKITNFPVIADDSGLMVDALDGFPGVYSARWAYPVVDSEQINALLLEKMAGLTNRNAQMVTIIAYFDPKTGLEKYFSGSIKGTITMKPRGNKVFGYDQIFVPENETKTFSELGDAKNNYNHRQIAIKKFVDYDQGRKNDEPES